jgi:fumarate reductase subunit C
MAMRRPYHRSMDGWWKRDGYFLHYMAREATAPFVAAYALVLLCGLLRLEQGEAAWEAWVDSLASPVSVALHLLLLAVFLYHTWTWFRIMPKTMPPVHLMGRRLSATAITGAGIAAAAVASAALWFAVMWIAR